MIDVNMRKAVMANAGEIKEAVRTRYRVAALEVTASPACCEPSEERGFGADLYEALDAVELPDGARLASLGCGNPVAVAELRPGETVLDLGSGAGLDVLLSARRVGPAGMAYGLDMTEEMLLLARRHQQEAGIENVEFLEGDISEIPLPDASVDVVISNCVINLSPEKEEVFREAHRVLRPGGRVAVTDIVTTRPFTAAERADLASWTGCIVGALTAEEFIAGLEAAGFENVVVEPTHEVGADVVSAVIRAEA